MNRRKTKNGPGRPANREPHGVRAALLAAARELLARRSLDTVSLRAIAAHAGVNPAMVHYYFGDRQGLITALLDESIAELIAAAEGAGTIGSLDALLEHWTRTVAANPWLPNLMVREVLYGHGELRETLLDRFAGRIGATLLALMEREQTRGRLRTGVDARLAVLSMMALAVYPFLAQPVAERVLGLRYDAALVERLIAHNRRLLHEGIVRDGLD